MKESERLKLEGDSEDNDLIAMGLYRKASRQFKEETFQESLLPKLIEVVGDVTEKLNGYAFVHPTYGEVIFYPKANKVFVYKKWIRSGYNWIMNNIL